MTRRTVLAAVLLVALAVPAAAAAQLPPFDPDPVPVPVVDCANPALRCPDLEMRAPYDLSVQRTAKGRSLLRSGNAILSVGRGPVALLGSRRTSSTRLRTMRVRQRISTSAGGHVEIDSPGRIVWKPIPGQDGYWKFENAARFELWTVGAGRRLVRTGPKVVYCFRDLQHVRPSARSPRARVYGACSQDRAARHVRLGTSVGWADVYPATYHEQYVDVTGLRGCFALWHIADPFNAIRESDETNNAARTIVTLRPGRSPIVGRCVRGT